MVKKVIAALLTTLSIANSNAETVTYKLVTDAPAQYKPTNVYIDLFDADTYLGPSIGYGVKVETVLLGKIMPSVFFKSYYLDANARHNKSDGYPMPDGGLGKQTVLDLGCTLFLIGKEKKKDLRVVLSSHSSGKYTFTKYTMIPGTIKRQFGVEGGIYYNRRALEFDDASHSLYKYKSSTGVESPIESVGGSGINQPAGNYYQPYSMTNVVSLYGGVKLRKITNLVVDVNGRKKSNAKVIDLYADIMLAPIIPIADIVDQNGAKWEIKPESNALRHLGWRAGAMMRGSRTASIQFNFEFGQKPGPKLGTGFMENGTYINMGVGLGLGFKKFL